MQLRRVALKRNPIPTPPVPPPPSPSFLKNPTSIVPLPLELFLSFASWITKAGGAQETTHGLLNMKCCIGDGQVAEVGGDGGLFSI